MERRSGSGWAVARTYRGAELVEVSMPLGGIGTGTVGFGGRGQLRDWELENHPSKGLLAPLTFLACRVVTPGRPPLARLLEGELFDGEVAGWQGASAPLAGIPRFAGCRFEATYPFGRVLLEDPDVPASFAVEAFNPLVPGDEAASGLPIAVFTVTVASLAPVPIEVDLLFSVEALSGHSNRAAGLPSRPSVSGRGADGVVGLLLADGAMDPLDEEWGTLAAAVLGEGVSAGPIWGLGKWNQGLSAMWRGFARSGRPAAGDFGLGGPGPSADGSIAGTLSTRRTLEPGAEAEATLVLAWHFPNRRAWAPDRGARGRSGSDRVGNHYATSAADAWQVLEAALPRLGELRERSERFVNALWTSDLDAGVKEAALFNLSTLRSQTFFRAAGGDPFGWEGCIDDAGSCLGSCTHVWNYELATGYLFAGLARRMRELEYGSATGPDGAMSFRIMLPLERARELPTVAADGQLGCVVKLYREWRLSGDDGWLRQLWPSCRRSLEFAWIEGGWDGDRDGLMEGAQHNTADVEYYGPNPLVQGWYLAALAAAVEMAGAAGDAPFARTCAELLAAGAKRTEATLFNGRYYEQKVVPPGDFAAVAARLRHETMGAELPDDPEFQIGEGCLVDQLVGDTWARLLGIGPVLDDDHVRAALESIHRLNYVPDFGDWTNCMRTYAVHGERGHLVVTYPGEPPDHPMPYWSEVWTGTEYVYAIGLAEQGEACLAEDVVAAVRERYDGRRRNPFDEAECGHHYVRAMASWGLVVAFTGFAYDARSKEMTFCEPPRRVRWFWSSGAAWGTVQLGGGEPPRLEVLEGELALVLLVVGERRFVPPSPGLLGAGCALELEAEEACGGGD